MAVEREDLWSDVEARLRLAIDRLGLAVKERRPDVRLDLSRSANDVKPLDLVATFSLPGRADEQVVLSVMFSRFRGPLELRTDVMREDGPFLLRLPPADLGTTPTEEAIRRSAEEAETFILNSHQLILKALGR